MQHPKVSNEEMMKRVLRFEDIKNSEGIPLMFIDSIIPGHHRMNYAIIGDTASENPEFTPLIDIPHKFQIGMFCAPPGGNGPAFHTHDYVEMFLILNGTWRFYWGNDPDGDPEGEVTLGQWDMITLPPGLWRGFENISDEYAWGFAVLDPHEVFTGKDPYWSQKVIDEAEKHGFKASEDGKMIHPDNYEALRDNMRAELMKGIK